jgi:two-component system, OmpR family, KDP operon response regulator KdpE
MPQLRILIADDEKSFRDFISFNLRARGFKTLEASNGLQAIEIWEQNTPDLLILDINMPHIDGIEVCRRVREQSSVPIIMITSLDTTQEKDIATKLGVNKYLTKPFDVETLLNAVRSTLPPQTNISQG